MYCCNGVRIPAIQRVVKEVKSSRLALHSSLFFKKTIFQSSCCNKQLLHSATHFGGNIELCSPHPPEFLFPFRPGEKVVQERCVE